MKLVVFLRIAIMILVRLKPKIIYDKTHDLLYNVDNDIKTDKPQTSLCLDKQTNLIWHNVRIMIVISMKKNWQRTIIIIKRRRLSFHLSFYSSHLILKIIFERLPKIDRNNKSTVSTFCLFVIQCSMTRYAFDKLYIFLGCDKDK